MNTIISIKKLGKGKAICLVGLLGCMLGCGTLQTHRGYLVESPTEISPYRGSRQVALEGAEEQFEALGFKMPVMLDVPALRDKTMQVLIDCDPQGEPYFYMDMDGDGKMTVADKLSWNIEGASQDRFARVEIPAWHFKDLPADERESVHMTLRFFPAKMKPGTCEATAGAPLIVGQVNERHGWINLGGKAVRIALLSGARYSMNTYFEFLIDLNADGQFDYDSSGGSDETYIIAQYPPEIAEQMPQDRYVVSAGKTYEIAAVAPLGAWVDLRESAKPHPPKEVLRIGDLAPDFTISDISGEPYHLAAHRGRPVFLQFWTQGCAGYLSQLDRLKSLYEQWHGKGFDILAVNVDGPEMDLAAFVKEHAIPWPMAQAAPDSDSSIYHQYKVRSVPYSYLIGPDGRVLKKDPTVRNLEPALAKLFP